MAVSYCSKWEWESSSTLEQVNNYSDSSFTSSFVEEPALADPEVAMELLGLIQQQQDMGLDHLLHHPQTLISSTIFEPPGSRHDFIPEKHYFSPSPRPGPFDRVSDHYSPPPPPLFDDKFSFSNLSTNSQLYPHPKRIKTQQLEQEEEDYYYYPMIPDLYSIPSTSLLFANPAFINSSIKAGNPYDNVPNPSSTTSAQSIAARQRRKKITDKTRELGKLIPGANKLNTADMFHAAHKYIKFLQAQLGILHFIQENEEEMHDTPQGQLQGLVWSSRIQEKLYSSEKCLVPKQLLQTIPIASDLN